MEKNRLIFSLVPVEPAVQKTLFHSSASLVLVSVFEGCVREEARRGVGRSATSSVVLSLLLIIVDAILVRFIHVFFPS